MRPAVLYISYDGAAEPLGQSQVVAYLERLAESRDITLVSFEKPGDDRGPMHDRLAAAGVRWRPLPYHRRPPVLGTAWDVLAGVLAVRDELRGRPAGVVHVRSDVAALIALAAGRPGGWRLLFDIRGFWAHERVDLGLWPAGGVLFRLARRCERRFYREADAVVTLTEASVPQIRRWLEGRDTPVAVIPTCTDTARFEGTEPRPGGPHAVWCGSFGAWYRPGLAARLTDALAMPVTVLTRDAARARALLAGRAGHVRSVAPDAIPGALCEGDVGLSLLSPSFAKTASAPTRVGEYLAAGMPVAATPGVGDLEVLLEGEEVGVIVRDESEAGLAVAARRLRELAADPVARARCRSVARRRLDLERGVHAYSELYARLGG